MGEAEVRFLTAEGNTVSTRPLAPAAGQQLKAWSIEQVWQAALGEPLEPRPSRSASETAETGAGDRIWAPAIAKVWEDLGSRPGYGYMQDMCISAEAVDVLGAWMRNWLQSVLGEATRLARYRQSTARASKADVLQSQSQTFFSLASFLHLFLPRITAADIQLAVTMRLRQGLLGPDSSCL
ncbi:unnamed protein product [Symbiodinium sp. CCMP2456]|nr:unnamed protein product [Symbiodinium sp. CCMP2456]